jgi:hypothetical protein
MSKSAMSTWLLLLPPSPSQKPYPCTCTSCECSHTKLLCNKMG